MSEADQNKIIATITRKLLWVLVPFILTAVGLQVKDHFTLKQKSDMSYVDTHYRELYRLTAELSTTMSMYMKANDTDKERLQARMDYLIERMDKFADHDVKRGESKLESYNRKREYGLEFTPLI